MSGPARQGLRGLRRLAAVTSRGFRTTATATTTRPTTPTARPGLCRCSAALFSSAAAAPTTTTNTTPPPAPRASLDLRHIREHAALHAANCTRRNYGALADHPARIVALFAQWQARQKDGRALREAANRVRRQLASGPAARDDDDDDDKARDGGQDNHDEDGRPALLAQARALKQQLAAIEADEARLTAEMQRLAAALPNLTSDATPDRQPAVLSYIHEDRIPSRPGAAAAAGSPDRDRDPWRSHVHIAGELGLVDFAAAAAAAGWGWYYLLGDGARLEQALVQYALAVAHRHRWAPVAPPSIVRSAVAAACGFQPRDHGGELQTYTLAGLPLSLAATAEVPLAALYADTTLDFPSEDDANAAADAADAAPIRRAAVSRCYRAEAGARGVRSKGLYRVHEFTKVELFAWTPPSLAAATDVFDELVDIQTEILSSLGLPCRVLEMPASDLGASAFRKIDIEAFFPGRAAAAAPADADADADDAAWGEVTSASICTDYQTRRLATRARVAGGPLAFPWTLNGTALAVPRVIAALLENGWDEETRSVTIPACLRPWMDGQGRLEAKRS